MMVLSVILILLFFILLGSIRIKLQEMVEYSKTKNQVINKINGEVVDVYSIRDNGEQGVEFLIFSEERWQWWPGENCIPAVKNGGEDEGVDVFKDNR